MDETARLAVDAKRAAREGHAIPRPRFKWENRPPGNVLYRGKFAFNTMEPNELQFDKADELWVSPSDNGWWRAHHTVTLKVGLVPSNYIAAVPEAEQQAQEQAEKVQVATFDAEAAAAKAKAIAAFEAAKAAKQEEEAAAAAAAAATAAAAASA